MMNQHDSDIRPFELSHPKQVTTVHGSTTTPEALLLLSAISIKGLTSRFRHSPMSVQVRNGKERWLTAQGELVPNLTYPLLLQRGDQFWAVNQIREPVQRILYELNDQAKYPDRCMEDRAEMERIERTIQLFRLKLYTPLNRAKDTTDYEERRRAVQDVITAMKELDLCLSRSPYMMGHRVTEPDLWVFAVLVRFDLVYRHLFGFDEHSLEEFPNITRLIYQLAYRFDLAELLNLQAEISRYFRSHIHNPLLIDSCLSSWGWDLDRAVIPSHRSFGMHDHLYS